MARFIFEKPANCPHKLKKTAGPLAGGAPPRAARTARARHVGCSSLLPLRVGRGSRRAAFRGRHVRRFLQLRVSTLAGPRDLRRIMKQFAAVVASGTNAAGALISNIAFPLAAPQGEERAATSKTRRRRSVASPPARRTLVTARFSLATHPGALETGRD